MRKKQGGQKRSAPFRAGSKRNEQSSQYVPQEPIWHAGNNLLVHIDTTELKGADDESGQRPSQGKESRSTQFSRPSITSFLKLACDKEFAFNKKDSEENNQGSIHPSLRHIFRKVFGAAQG